MPAKNKKSNQKSKLSSATKERLKLIQQKKAEERERIRKEAEEKRLQEEEEERLREEELKKQQQANAVPVVPKKKKSAAQKKRAKKLAAKRQTLLRMKDQQQMGGSSPKPVATPLTQAQIVEKQVQEKLDVQENMRSPIVCVLGHVDTGKTKILDYIRQTKVQDGEVGGITQQIGASYFPIENIRRRTMEISGKLNIDYQLPGLLIIDTPGHDTFTNLRERGTSLCDVAILVIDIMHGIEQQTLESIEILKKAKVPFVIALNKVDRLVGWQSTPDEYIEKTLSKQSAKTMEHYRQRVKDIKYKLNQHSVTSLLYYKNTKKKKIISMVPVSAHTGEGIPDLLALVVFLTQKFMTTNLTLVGNLSCSVMEVKTEVGVGSTIDVILSNGVLHEHDKIILATLNGPVVTSIRGLLTPKPLRELRVKGSYINHKEITASMGVRIIGNDLDHVVAGTPLLRIEPSDTAEEIEAKKVQVMKYVSDVMDNFVFDEKGVFVKASTLGSLEALISLLKRENIPIAMAGIGKLTKKDMIRASAMRDEGQYSTDPIILAFNIKPEKEILAMAQKDNVQLFSAEIVYNLLDMYARYIEETTKASKQDHQDLDIMPCELQILDQYVFNRANPFVFGVKLLAGKLRVGTPIIVPPNEHHRGVMHLGMLTSIQRNNKEVTNQVKIGDEVCIKIEEVDSMKEQGEPVHYLYKRQFSDADHLYSRLSRQSIDYLKQFYENEFTKDDWMLVIKIKKILNIR